MDNNPNNEYVPPENSQPINQQPIAPNVNPVGQTEPRPFSQSRLVITPINDVVPDDISSTVNPEPTPPQSYPVQSTEPVSPTQLSVEPAVIAVPQPGMSLTPIEPKKKSRKLLWIILGVVFVILVGLITGYLLINSSVDKAVSDYTSSLKTYLGKVNSYLAVESATPVEIKSAMSSTMSNISEPILKNIPFGSLNSKYSDAEKLVADTKEKISTLNTQLDGYVSVYDYEITGNQILLEMNTLKQPAAGAEAKYFSTVLDIEQRMKVLIDKNKDQAPSELKSTFEEIAIEYAGMIKGLTAMIAAMNNKDAVALKVAQTDFMTSYNANGVTTSKRAIAIYYNGLSSKIKASADELKKYADGVK